AAQAERLVEHLELDAFETPHQPMLDLADDPDDSRLGPRALDGAHDRHRMTRIADRREPHDAELGRRRADERTNGIHRRACSRWPRWGGRSAARARVRSIERFALEAPAEAVGRAAQAAHADAVVD